MLSKLDERRFYPIALAVLATLTVLLVLRSGQTVTNVMSLRNRMIIDAGSESYRVSSTIRAAAQKDSMLADVNGAVADPFRTGATRPAEIPSTNMMPAQPVYSLGLNGLLYDDVDPVVQLGFGPDKSAWLHVGESFRNWKVVEISQRNVTLRKGSRTKVLD